LLSVRFQGAETAVFGLDGEELTFFSKTTHFSDNKAKFGDPPGMKTPQEQPKPWVAPTFQIFLKNNRLTI